MKTENFFGVLSLIIIFEIYTVSVRMRVYQYLRVFEVILVGRGVCIFFLTFGVIRNENYQTVKKMFRVG